MDNKFAKSLIPKGSFRKNAFTREQAIVILTKQDSKLNFDTQPDLWYGYVDYSKNVKNKLQVVIIPFNFSPQLVKTSKLNSVSFAIMPCDSQISRILLAISNLAHPSFKELLLAQSTIPQIKFKNVLKNFVSLNESQTIALQSSLNNKVTLLQGPPGTGKTSTIYEILLQLYKQLNYYPIVVCAASNIAVDNIAEKLMKENKDLIIRVVSNNKEKEYSDKNHPLYSVCLHNLIYNGLPANMKEIHDLLIRNRDAVSKNQFAKYMTASKELGKNYIRQARIILSTTVNLSGSYLKEIDSMPVIVMDEATQCSEPASLIALGAPNIKKIIMVVEFIKIHIC
ncbi:unnamed protein product [[Candida] boidinii]|nr:unnamed protein product [[Candida] boidinii]